MFCVFVTGTIIPLGANWLMLGANQSETRHAEYYHRKCEAQNPISLFSDSHALIDSTPGVLEPNPHKPKPEDAPDNPDYCDLAAQYLAARSAEASSYWAALSFAATLTGLILLWRTLALTRDALKETERATLAVFSDQRARLTVELVRDSSLPPRMQGDIAHLDGGIITIKNIGRNLATNIGIFHRGFTVLNAERSYEEFRKRFDEEVAVERQQGKMILFPHESTDYDAYFHFRAGHILMAARKKQTGSKAVCYGVIVVTYNDGANEERCHTVVGYFFQPEQMDTNPISLSQVKAIDAKPMAMFRSVK